MDQYPVFRFYPIKELWSQFTLITKLLANMGKVHSSHQTDLLITVGYRLFQGLYKRRHMWIFDRRVFAQQHVVKRRHQNRDNGEVPSATRNILQDVLQEHGLKLERMLGPVECFIRKQVAGIAAL